VSDIDIRLEGLPGREPGEPEPAWLEACRDFAGAALRELGAKDWEVSIVLCGDPFIRELNEKYRGLEEPTDVLSFPQQPPEGGMPRNRIAGDIVISLDSLTRNAEREGESRETELKRLLIHGMLHLQGLDHPDEEDSPMLRTQESLLEKLRETRIRL
jgi:probable rRNA maturation factor